MLRHGICSRVAFPWQVIILQGVSCTMHVSCSGYLGCDATQREILRDSGMGTGNVLEQCQPRLVKAGPSGPSGSGASSGQVKWWPANTINSMGSMGWMRATEISRARLARHRKQHNWKQHLSRPARINRRAGRGQKLVLAMVVWKWVKWRRKMEPQDPVSEPIEGRVTGAIVLVEEYIEHTSMDHIRDTSITYVRYKYGWFSEVEH